MLKRLIDVVLAICALILFAPVILGIALLVLLNFGGPIIFTQTRPGLFGKPFKIYKFRSMKELLDINGEPLSDNERLTSFGKALRATSLDELPNLWAILMGDMSIVGPRPLLMEYLPLYSKEQEKRHNVKPGLTGWAQVNGRNAITWEEKFKLDVWYVENQNFWLDIEIIFLTGKNVVCSKDINADGEVAMAKFKGTK